jgi:serralysin
MELIEMAQNQIRLLTGPSTTQTPYVVATDTGVWFTSILSAGDQVGLKDGPANAGQPWRMVGIPDGLGAFDNGDGTITVLLNHELGATSGVVRDHGATGAFVSKLIIDKASLEVQQADDLSQQVFLYDRASDSYVETITQFGRLCSADLPPISAFYDAATGLGSTERIFLNGEEVGNEGRAFAHVVTGAEAGDSYELPALGRMSWENSLANPYTGAKTVIMCQDDSTPGEVYLYVGQKQATGTAVEKAGLTNGKLFGVAASFGDDGPGVQSGTFTLLPQGVEGDVTHTTGTELQGMSSPLTQFGRPEDGAWDPSNPSRYYFVTTGTPAQPTRLWAMDFVDLEHPELGGKITALVEGGFSNSDPNSTLPLMLDNMTVTESGLVVMQEDPGNNPRLAKVWIYDPKADNGIDPMGGLTELAQHDPARFTNPVGPTATPAPGSTLGFGRDEESSGIMDATSLLGGDQRLAFLLDTQAHYAFSPGEIVEGGQLMSMYVELPNPGDSRFKGEKGADNYDGGFGNDRIDGNAGNDTLYGNYGDDVISGGDGNDNLSGGVGQDRVVGGNGNDTIDGGTGDDELLGNDGNDSVVGGVGNDKIDGGRGADLLVGGFGQDRVAGGEGNDRLEGDQGADDLDGGRGNDVIIGGSGDDRLTGGRGLDSLTGGEGGDVFVVTQDGQQDVILDFSAADDAIDVSAFARFSAAHALASAKQVGDDVVIKLDHNVTITLEQADLADLSVDNFTTHQFDLLA